MIKLDSLTLIFAMGGVTKQPKFKVNGGCDSS